MYSKAKISDRRHEIRFDPCDPIQEAGLVYMHMSSTHLASFASRSLLYIVLPHITLEASAVNREVFHPAARYYLVYS